VYRSSQNNDLIIYHPDLRIGGAEKQIVLLIKGLLNKGYKIVLVLNWVTGPYLSELPQSSNLEIVNLEKKSYAVLLLKLYCLFRNNKSATVYTFLVGQNVIGLVLGKIANVRKIVWGNRVSRFSRGEFGVKGELAFLFERFGYKFVDKLISNSQEGKNNKRVKGLCPNKNVVICNGIDVDRYREDKELRKSFRDFYEIGPKDVVFGIICRIVSWKGIKDYIVAASLLSQEYSEAKFFCAGNGNKTLLAEYKEEAKRLGVEIVWLGERQDIEKILNGIDLITVASSQGEGFPNIIGEAMAVGKAIVATDVGDNAELIKSIGTIVDKNNPRAIYSAWKSYMDKKELLVDKSNEARDKVLMEFSIQSMVNLTEKAIF
jgi:glycosyltransferase involved in cell wall biosynthesis